MLNWFGCVDFERPRGSDNPFYRNLMKADRFMEFAFLPLAEV